MTIANGSLIEQTDLETLVAPALLLVRADNADEPGGLQEHYVFQDLTAAIVAANPERAQVRFIAPFDLLVESVAVEVNDHTAAATTTVAVTGNGAVEDWPITVTGVAGATGKTKFSRLLYDNTKTAPTSPTDFPLTSRAFRVWPKGTEVRLTVTTTNAATPTSVHVALVCREFYARE